MVRRLVFLLVFVPTLAAGADCPADGTVESHTNAVYDPSSNSGVATPGPKLPPLSERPTRTYGAIGSCVGSADDGFDGGEIIVPTPSNDCCVRGPAGRRSQTDKETESRCALS